MFQDYRLKQKFRHTHQVDRVCLSQSGVILAASLHSLQVMHIEGWNSQIELFAHFRNQFNLDYMECRGLKEIGTNHKIANQSRFAVIMDQTLWYLAVEIRAGKTPSESQIQICRLTMLTEPGQSEDTLGFIDDQSQMVLMAHISSKVQICQILKNQQYAETFMVQRLQDLQFRREEEEKTVENCIMLCTNLLFSIFQGYVMIYNQFNEQLQFKNQIFFYKLKPNQLPSQITYPSHIVALPLFTDFGRLLVHVQAIPTDQEASLEHSLLFAIYQLPQGLQIVEVTFDKPSIIHRKHLYSNITFSQLLSSSINPHIIQLQGIQHCLEQYTILVVTSEGVGMNSSLTLIKMPSTNKPSISHQLALPYSLNSTKCTPQGIWICSAYNIHFAQIIPKAQIYRSFLSRLEQSNSVNLSHLAKQIGGLLE